jgi:hypothetical protein
MLKRFHSNEDDQRKRAEGFVSRRILRLVKRPVAVGDRVVSRLGALVSRGVATRLAFLVCVASLKWREKHSCK